MNSLAGEPATPDTTAMPEPKKKRTLVKDCPCPHCGVLFAKNNLTMHVSAKHGGGSPAAGETPKRQAASRSEAPAAPASTPSGKKPYDYFDSETW